MCHFQAVHIPVQAPQEYIEKYMGRYDEGWHKLREERHLQAVALGILPEVGKMQVMPTTSDWEALDPKENASKRNVWRFMPA